MSEASSSLEPTGRLLELLNARIVAQGLYVAAQFGLADLVAGGNTSVEVPHQGDGHGTARHLQRVLRMLGGEGVFRDVRSGEFALTPLGETLRTDSQSSVPDRALYLGAPEVWTACGQHTTAS